MRELKILHTSDLLIGSITSAAKEFSRLVEELAQRDLERKIDYLVISGNLTADGSQASFTRASELLTILADRLMRSDPRVAWTKRLLIVPGPCDTRDANSFANFKRFHDRLFADEEPFDDTRAILRDLKDLTFVGLSYWTPSDSHGLGKSLEEMRQVIAAARERIVRLDYTKLTPTILVSAASIAFDGDPQSLASFRAIQSDLKVHFRTKLHLYGANCAPSELPSPVRFEHVGFGTGSRPPGCFWPCTFNLLCVRRDVLEENVDFGVAPFLSARLFQIPGEGEPLLDREWIHGHLDAFYKRESVKRSKDALYKPALDQLEENLRPGATIAFMGFPGAGKENLFNYLSGRDRLVERKIHVVPMTLTGYDDFPTQLQIALDQLRSKSRESETTSLLLIHDTWFAQLPISEKSKLLDLLRDNNPHSSVDGLCVLLLLTAADYSLGQIQVLPLPPLEQEAIPDWVREYSRFVPIEESHLQNLGGGYAGFTERLLKGAQAWFEKRPGAESMHRGTPATVMEHALREPIVTGKARWHRENLQLLTGGEDVYQHVAGRIQEMQARASTRSFAELAPVRINVSTLEAQYAGNQRKSRAVRRAVEHLGWSGILAKDDAHEDEFIVRLLAPFRRGIISDPPLCVKWPEVTDVDLILPADVVIIAPYPDEREAVLNKLPNARLVPVSQDERVYSLAKVPAGGDKSYRVAVMSLRGPGQVQATAGTKDAIVRWNPTAVLLVGIAGGVEDNDVSLGDVLVASTIASNALQKAKVRGTDTNWEMSRVDSRFYEAAQHFSIEGSLGLITAIRPGNGKPRLHFGPMVSGNVVVARKRMVDSLRKTHPKVIGIEMEAWGVLSAVEQKIAFFMVRGVSDLADVNKDDSWRAYARDTAASYAIALLQRAPLQGGESNA